MLKNLRTRPTSAVRAADDGNYLVLKFYFQNLSVKMLEFHVHLVSIKTCGNDLKLLKNGMLLTSVALNKYNHFAFVSEFIRDSDKSSRIKNFGKLDAHVYLSQRQAHHS